MGICAGIEITLKWKAGTFCNRVLYHLQQNQVRVAKEKLGFRRLHRCGHRVPGHAMENVFLVIWTRLALDWLKPMFTMESSMCRKNSVPARENSR